MKPILNYEVSNYEGPVKIKVPDYQAMPESLIGVFHSSFILSPFPKDELARNICLSNLSIGNMDDLETEGRKINRDGRTSTPPMQNRTTRTSTNQNDISL